MKTFQKKKVLVLCLSVLLAVCAVVSIAVLTTGALDNPENTTVISSVDFNTSKNMKITIDSPESSGFYTDSKVVSPFSVIIEAKDGANYYYTLQKGDYVELAPAPYSSVENDKALHVFEPISSNGKATKEGGGIAENQIEYGAVSGWWNGTVADGSVYALEFDFYAESFGSSLTFRKRWSMASDSSACYIFGITPNASSVSGNKGFQNVVECGVTKDQYEFVEGRWYHIAWVAEAVNKNKTILSCYINGERVKVRNAAGTVCDSVTMDGRELADSYSYFCFGRENMIADNDLYIDNVQILKSKSFDHTYDAKITSDTLSIDEKNLVIEDLHAPITVDEFLKKIKHDENVTVKLLDSTGNEIKSGIVIGGAMVAVYADCVEKPKLYSYGVENKVVLGTTFRDHMVIQRNKPFTVNGTVTVPGSEIAMSIGDFSGTTVADDNGAWSFEVPAMEAVTGLTLTVGGESILKPVTVSDIAIGEVWILAGQSNMDYEAYKLEDAAEYAALASTVKNLRIFVEDTPHYLAGWYKDPQTQVFGTWYTDPAQALNSVSAIGYVMGAKLASELKDVTVAIVDVCYSGSTIQTWMSVESLEAHPELKTEYQNHLSTLGNEKSYWYSSFAYNTMIAPLTGMTAAGVLWYQGEGNTGNAGDNGTGAYNDYFKTLLGVWRKTFGNDDTLPFVVVQLAPYIKETYAKMRNVQYNTCKENENCYLVTTGLEGTIFNELDNKYGEDASNIHTSRKSSIGLQSADVILKNIYGKDVLTAPDVVSVTLDGNAVRLKFDSAIDVLFGDGPEGFELLGADGNVIPSVAAIEGDTVVLTFESGAPVRVRYAYAPMVIYCQDGSVIRNVQSMTLTEKYTKMLVKYLDENGASQSIEFVAGQNKPVRTTYGGNIINASGYVAPSFVLEIETEA